MRYFTGIHSTGREKRIWHMASLVMVDASPMLLTAGSCMVVKEWSWQGEGKGNVGGLVS